MKNKILSIGIMALAVILMLPVAVHAQKGVGIVWDTEFEIVNQGETRCVQYGVYNPWDEAVTAQLTVSDELKSVITSAQSETKAIPAGTTHDKAIPIELCFKVEGVYPENCLAGGQMCEQTCSVSEVSYNGKIIATEKAAVTTGSGSATAVQAAVPLALKVRCVPHTRNFTLVYVVMIVLAITAMAAIFFNRTKKKGKR